MNEILNVQHLLPAQLIGVGKRTTQLLDERLMAVALSSPQLWTLKSIVSADRDETLVTVTCLADVMHTTKSNVTAMVDRLIAEGLVTRSQSSEDRRTVVIALTEEGQRRYAAGLEVIRAFHTELANRFTPEEQQLLKCIADKLP